MGLTNGLGWSLKAMVPCVSRRQLPVNSPTGLRKTAPCASGPSRSIGSIWAPMSITPRLARGSRRTRKPCLMALTVAAAFSWSARFEPRKGHAQALEAFEQLWQTGTDASLVIVGKQGWLVEELVGRLRAHPEMNKHLFWLAGISDEYLEKVYAASTCLIAASYGEGFGLPLIEAAQHKLPIIARDIPVFHEVAGEHAYYFSGKKPTDVTQTISEWLKLYAANAHPLSDNMTCLTWKESSSQLGLLLGNTVPENLSTNFGNLLILKPRIRLYVDISVVYRDDFKTGIQRVVRAVLSEFIKSPQDDYIICPVYLNDSSGTWEYHNVPSSSASPETEGVPISARCGDVLLGLDLAGGYVVSAFRQDLYRKLMDTGVLVYFVVYDLLPVLTPQFFSVEASKSHEQWLRCICQSDGVICISKSVADEFSEWSRKINEALPKNFSVNFFHLGGDINASVPTSGMPGDAESTLNLLSLRPSFLMVGTVEPRKGHTQALAAFEKLWEQGLEVNLVIVGKQGWKMESLTDRLRHHPELNKRLFWLEGISDEYLEKVYASSACLIAASEGEGFGLPLIEAAQHKLPIIARDIPVFREVAGEHAHYFNGLEPQALADAVKCWLILNAEGKAPQSIGMPCLSWKQSAEQLISRVLLGWN